MGQNEVRFNVPTTDIIANDDNPRLIFSEDGMLRLVKSIKEVGILVPLTVYRRGSKFVILDGERRWRAAKRINLKEVPCYILPEPTDRVEYILNMFKIHNVREEWKLLPTAQKIGQVIEQIEKKTGRVVTDKELATYTGLPYATVGRCRKLLSLPVKYQDMLFEEEKLEEEGIKPTRTTLSEDFFLELLSCVSAIQSKKANLQKFCARYETDRVMATFVEKFRSGNIPDITDFRYLTKIVKQTRLPVDKRERILTHVLDEQSYRIDEAYDVYARPFYESDGLEKQLGRIEGILESMDISLLDRGSGILFLNSLENFRKIIQDKIIVLKGSLDKKTDDAK